MDLIHMRAVLRPHVISLYGRNTHATIPDTCQKLGMGCIEDGTRQVRITKAFDDLPDSTLQKTAELFLIHFPPNARERNELQDILWADLSLPVINKKIRRELAAALDAEDLYLDARRFDELLDRLWVLDDGSSGVFEALLLRRPYQDRSLRALIQQHVHKNSDFSASVLFEMLGALDCSDKRFALFLEGLVSAEVRPDESSQRRFVELVNKAIKESGAELRETDSKDGYPLFTLVRIHGAVAGRPKNLIFASQVKPDMRFIDAINNDIEIVTNSDKVLVYDRPISSEGLTWSDLQAWWADSSRIPNDKNAKSTLYRRLLASLPGNSPPQRLLFESYFKRFKNSIPGLPALLPEVWLHWDPKTVKERGRDALFRFRMDFLMLLPGGVRVVLEVDGQQHYSDASGRPSAANYGAMVSADRDLKLLGYQVFHFGGAELSENSAPAVGGGFFGSLFKRFGVRAD
jgi:AbiJ N-terminal domain 3